jgi:sulfur-carrier protein
MAKLIIPTPLRKFTAEQSTFQGNGATVGEVIRELTTAHGGLQTHLIGQDGKLRSFIRVYVGDEDITRLQGEDTPVDPNTVISIIPAIAGGISSTPSTALA